MDDLSHGHEQNLASAITAGTQLAVVDVREREPLDEVFASFRPDLVFHLAAQVDVRVSMAQPAQDAVANIVGSINVLAAAAAHGVRRLVNTSTGGAIYGGTTVVPTPETEPAVPLSPYGLSKRTAEEYAAWFDRAHGLDTVTLRYGNVYGPRQDPAGDAGVVAIFCDRVLSGCSPTVFGDGRQTRDYVFVGDIVAANLAAARIPTLSHAQFNIGSGVETSVLQLIAATAEAAGVYPADFAPVFRPARPGEVRRSCLDVSRARAHLGLSPPTPLSKGLRHTMDWVRTLTR